MPAGGALYDDAAVGRMRAGGAVVHLLRMSRQPSSPVNLAALAELIGLIRRVNPTVVHGHSSVGGALARVAGRLAGVPVVYTANGVATATSYRLVERVLGPLTWRWVAVSPSEADLARRWGLAGGERLVTIANGIEVAAPLPADARLRLRELIGVPAGTTVVGSVARLVEQKAPVDFVRACAVVAAGHPDAHFLLVGMGPLQAQLDRAVGEAGLGGRWHQIPHLPDAAEAVAGLDVFVLASRFEGGPYTPLEAMRAGVPVVLTDVVGNRDCVEAGLSGLLCPAGDHQGLAAAVVGLLGDPARRSAMGEAGRQRVAEHFDVRRMGAGLARLYQSAPRRGRRS